jgi:hypothetical protein
VSWHEHLRPAALPGTALECTATRHALSPEASSPCAAPGARDGRVPVLPQGPRRSPRGPRCACRVTAARVRQVSHAEAGGLPRDAIASFWTYGAGPGADRGERYGLLCSSLAMASAGAAVLAAGGAVTDGAAERWPGEARRALVGEFLASPQAAELRDPVARTGAAPAGHVLSRAPGVPAGADRAVGAGAGPGGRAGEGGDHAGPVRQGPCRRPCGPGPTGSRNGTS